MKNASQIVIHFYDVCNKKQGQELEKLVAEDIIFEGSLMRLSGASQYLQTVGPFLKFHKGMRMLRQFEDGEHVCSIYEMDLGTPAGGVMTSAFADWTRVANGKIAEHWGVVDISDVLEKAGLVPPS